MSAKRQPAGKGHAGRAKRKPTSAIACPGGPFDAVPRRLPSTADREGGRASLYYSTRVTFVACIPLGPSTMSNWTCWPSLRVRNPSILMEEWWTKMSPPPPSRSMKPYPFLSLNHFTLPIGIHSPSFPGPVSEGARTDRFGKTQIHARWTNHHRRKDGVKRRLRNCPTTA